MIQGMKIKIKSISRNHSYWKEGCHYNFILYKFLVSKVFQSCWQGIESCTRQKIFIADKNERYLIKYSEMQRETMTVNNFHYQKIILSKIYTGYGESSKYFELNVLFFQILIKKQLNIKKRLKINLEYIFKNSSICFETSQQGIFLYFVSYLP